MVIVRTVTVKSQLSNLFVSYKSETRDKGTYFCLIHKKVVFLLFLGSYIRYSPIFTFKGMKDNKTIENTEFIFGSGGGGWKP